MSEWVEHSFEDVADYDVGRTPSRANPAFWVNGSESVPWVTISDMEPFGTVTSTKEAVSAPAMMKVFAARIVPAGTLLMSFKLTIGRVATLGTPTVHNEAIISIYPRLGMDQRFLGYYLSQVDYTQSQDRQIKGNTLNKAKIDKISVLAPQESEQRNIADALDLVRGAAQAHASALDATEALKRAVMYELFTRGLRGADPQASEVGPEDWVTERLGEHHSVASGGTPSRAVPEYWVGGTIHWVKTTEVNYNVISETSERVTQTGLDSSAAKVVPAGTVLLAMYGQGVTRGRVAVLGIDAATNQACAAIRSTGQVLNPRYLYHFLANQYEELRNLAHGGQQQNLNLDIIRDFPVSYPVHADEQQAIVDILDALDAKIDLHRRKRALYEELFQALLHGLMTRGIDVDNLDLSALPAREEASA